MALFPVPRVMNSEIESRLPLISGVVAKCIIPFPYTIHLLFACDDIRTRMVHFTVIMTARPNGSRSIVLDNSPTAMCRPIHHSFHEVEDEQAYPYVPSLPWPSFECWLLTMLIIILKVCNTSYDLLPRSRYSAAAPYQHIHNGNFGDTVPRFILK